MIHESAVIHATAIIHEGARIGANVEIGPWSLIGADVEIGDECTIASHVVIKGPTKIGSRNRIFQWKLFWKSIPSPYGNLAVGIPERTAERCRLKSEFCTKK